MLTEVTTMYWTIYWWYTYWWHAHCGAMDWGTDCGAERWPDDGLNDDLNDDLSDGLMMTWRCSTTQTTVRYHTCARVSWSFSETQNSLFRKSTFQFSLFGNRKNKNQKARFSETTIFQKPKFRKYDMKKVNHSTRNRETIARQLWVNCETIVSQLRDNYQ